MRLFDKIKEPVFLKEATSAEVHLAALQELSKTATGDIAAKIEQDMVRSQALSFSSRSRTIPQIFPNPPQYHHACVYFSLEKSQDGFDTVLTFLSAEAAKHSTCCSGVSQSI